MASLALGLVGGFFGGPAGYLIGSMLGNLLFPQKVQGPRLTDLHLHTSSYGGMTPIVYGAMRVAGNIDWQTDLQEHEDTSGGKGGPEVTTYTYSASFGVTLCEGPIAGIGKIWANGRKIYDRLSPVNGQSDLPITVYLGTETQMPDPTMQAHLGANNVPAYRGLARVVFTDWMLTEYSNTIPNLNFEVYTSAGDIPTRISTFASPEGLTCASFDAASGVITISTYNITDKTYSEHQYDIHGNAVGTPIDAAPLGNGAMSGVTCRITNSNICFVPSNTLPDMWWIRGVPAVEILTGKPYSIGVLQGNYLYCMDQWTGQILRYPTNNGVPGGTYDASYTIGGDSSDTTFGSSDNHRLYAFNAASLSLYEFDENLSLLHTWVSTDFPAGFSPSSVIHQNSLIRYNNMFAFSMAGLGFDKLTLLAIASDNSLSIYQNPDGTTPDYQYARGPVIALSGGYVLGIDGVTLLNPQLNSVRLADIVADLSRRAGLSDSQFDTSGLPDLVRGYLITQQQAVRSDIDPLRQAYFFDGVEVDDKVVFVKRGKDSVVSIPDDDLAAYADGQTPPPVLATDRSPEVDLPALVSVNFVNAEADYETGTQQAQRQTTQSQSTVTIDLPISLTHEETKAIAQTHIALTWLERDAHSITVPRKYSAYVPTDVVTVQGRAIQVRDKKEAASGVIQLDGVPSLGRVFIQAPKSAGGSGFTPATPGGGATSAVATTAVLMDLPLVTDADTPTGFYVAMDGASAWPGAALYKSSDGGTSYASVFSESTAQTMGTVTSVLSPFLGGNTFDEINQLTVVLTSGELSSATELAVLNGANEAAVGAEIIQFKNATLVAANTYTLSGLLRGRRGTEWAMAHGPNETFVLLPAPRVTSPASDINVTRLYKPVTFGATIGSTTEQPFVNSGASLKPYAPVLLGGGVDGSGNVTLNWTRRTRIGGAWAPFADVPLSESSESYVVQVWNSDYTKCAHVITGVTSQTTTYTSAQQVTDFGAQQKTIYFTVGQLGSIGLGYQARGTAGGAGASNNDPLSPVSPYQSGTSGSPAPSSVPQLTLSMGWANVRKLSSSVGTFNCSNVLVASFTTPASTANGVIGWISAVEWVDPAVFRVACLSTVAGDFSGSALSRVVSKDPTCFFSVGTNPDGYPQLSPSTTYYFNVKNDDGNGVCTCLSSSCGVAVELTKPTGL